MSENITKEERRSHSRLGKRIHLRPKSVFGKNGLVENISLGGMRIQSQKEYSSGEILQLQMSLVEDEWFEANVRVVWINENKQDAASGFDIGCEFVNLPFDMQNALWVLLDKNSSNH